MYLSKNWWLANFEVEEKDTTLYEHVQMFLSLSYWILASIQFSSII